MKPKSKVWMCGVILIVFFVVFSLSAQAYGYPSRGIEIKTKINLENATQGLSEENREYIFGVHEFLEGSKFRGVLYRSHYESSVGVLLTEKYLLISLERDDNRNPSNIDWKSIVNDELKWLTFVGATEISEDDIVEIVAVTKCCGCVERVDGKWMWHTIRGNNKILNQSCLKMLVDKNIIDKNDIQIVKLNITKSVIIQLNKTILNKEVNTSTGLAIKSIIIDLEKYELNITKDGILHKVVLKRDRINKSLILVSNKIAARNTNNSFEVKKNRIYLRTEKGDKEIKILPDMASETAKEVGIGSIEDIELKSIREEPIYVAKGIKEGKLLAVIPVSLGIETEINADTGAIETIKKPWWDIFVF